MMAITHGAIAAAGTSLLFSASDLMHLALAVVGSQLPDLASTESVVGQSVQLFWPEPVWCIIVSNSRRRLITGGPGEYWVLSIAVGLLVLGCWMAGRRSDRAGESVFGFA